MCQKSLASRPATGWRSVLPAGLDSARTLVLAFAAPLAIGGCSELHNQTMTVTMPSEV